MNNKLIGRLNYTGLNITSISRCYKYEFLCRCDLGKCNCNLCKDQTNRNDNDPIYQDHERRIRNGRIK